MIYEKVTDKLSTDVHIIRLDSRKTIGKRKQRPMFLGDDFKRLRRS